MAKFLTREGIVCCLEKIIEDAKHEIILISPYIKADDVTKNLLKNTRRTTAVHIIYGKKELESGEKDFLDSHSIKTSFLKNLHAKCYLNENEALLTSMNLLESSQKKNDEMGILVSKKDDEELYTAIYEQAVRWKTASNDVEADKDAKARFKARRSRGISKTNSKKPTKGYCIQCKAVLPASPSAPYCKRDFWSWWNSSKDSKHEEKYCHLCGKEWKVSLVKPLCLSCYRKHKGDFKFWTAKAAGR